MTGEVFYNCTVCNEYFESYVAATEHLGLQHSASLMTAAVVGQKGSANDK
jgi:hypothetical protein